MRYFKAPGGVMPAPDPRQRRRRSGLSGVADEYPNPEGGPGNFIYPYNERRVWGAPPDGLAQPPPVGAPNPNAGVQWGNPSAPFGESDRPWTNPTVFASVPINAATSSNNPVLSLNMQRNALIIQNNSTATAPDTTPIFWIGFNAQPIAGFSLGIAAGLGVLFDIITPRDSIYVLQTGGSGASLVVQGVVVQGLYSP